MMLLAPHLSLALLLCFVPACRKSTPPRSASTIQQKWQFTASEPIRTALALADDGTLYAATEKGSLYALSSSGDLQWKFSTGPVAAAPAVGSDGTIYVADMGQSVYAINHGGSQQWTRAGGPRVRKDTPWRGGALDEYHYFTPWEGAVRAYRINTGALESDWAAGDGFELAGSASMLSSGTIVFPDAGRITAADSSARILWQYPEMNPPFSIDMLAKNGHVTEGNFWIESGIAVGSDDTLYASAIGSRFVAIGSNGTLKWEFKAKEQGINYATPVISEDGTIYFGAQRGTLYALNPGGSLKWELDTGGQIEATPIIAQDGTLYVLNHVWLCAISPEGKLLEKVAFSGAQTSSPTLAPDGTLYAASRAGTITAFSTTHGSLMNSSWPKFQRDLGNTGRVPRS